MKNKQKGFSVVEIVMAVMIIGLLAAVGWLFYDKAMNKPVADSINSTKNSTESPKAEPNKQATVKYGTIKGKASYPSESLPSDEEVCAESTDKSSADPICINVGKAQSLVFEFKVPVGSYYVYSKSSQFPDANYKAYYNEYSKCGYQYGCPAAGHKQYITVTVGENAVVENVDPGDWYAN